MTFPDLINGAFEGIGGVFVLNHCRVLWRDKHVAGVSKMSTAIFFAWGLWNLYFYPALDQWLSFAGGLVIVAGNCLWLAMMIYYSRRPGGVVARAIDVKGPRGCRFFDDGHHRLETGHGGSFCVGCHEVVP